MEKQVQQDLYWLWCLSDSELGQSSNWNAMIQVKYQKSSTWKDNFHEGYLTTLHKRRQLQQRLAQLPQEQQYILFAHFGSYITTYYLTDSIQTGDKERHTYFFIYKQFRELAPTAILLSNLSPTQLNNLCKQPKKLQQAYSIEHLKQQAKQAYHQAIQAFFHCRIS